jgi:hypothetical protein
MRVVHDSIWFHHLVDTVAPAAPVTPNEAQSAIEIAALVGAHDHALAPEEREALRTLIDELGDVPGGQRDDAWVDALPRLATESYAAQLDALISRLRSPGAADLAFAAASTLTSNGRVLAQLRHVLGISEQHAGELVGLARVA